MVGLKISLSQTAQDSWLGLCGPRSIRKIGGLPVACDCAPLVSQQIGVTAVGSEER